MKKSNAKDDIDFAVGECFRAESRHNKDYLANLIAQKQAREQIIADLKTMKNPFWRWVKKEAFMLKEIDKKWLMSQEILGKTIIIETTLGSIKEQIHGVICKQRWVEDSMDITLVAPSGLFAIGVDSVDKIILDMAVCIYICPVCKKVCIWDQWIVLDVPEGIITTAKCCPECDVDKTR